MRTFTDMTVYNKAYDDAAGYDVYYRTYLRGIHWEESQGANIIKSGMAQSDKLFVMIPFSVDCESKQYMTAKAYGRASDKRLFWTLKPGDIIAEGIVTDELTNLKDFGKVHDYFTITTVDFYGFGSEKMKHWEVGAK